MSNDNKNKESINLELKRQLFHIVSLVFIIPIYFLELIDAAKVIAVLALLFMFGDWYYLSWKQRKEQIEKTVKNLAHLSEEKKKEITSGYEEFLKFERKFLDKYINQMRRARERRPFVAGFNVAFASLIALVLFGTTPALMGIIAIAIGDSLSTLVGLKFGNHKLLYNDNKSLEGSIAFILATFAFASIFLIYFSELAFIDFWMIAAITAIIGSLIESLPLVNDNITVPIAVGFFIYLAMLL